MNNIWHSQYTIHSLEIFSETTDIKEFPLRHTAPARCWIIWSTNFNPQFPSFEDLGFESQSAQSPSCFLSLFHSTIHPPSKSSLSQQNLWLQIVSNKKSASMRKKVGLRSYHLRLPQIAVQGLASEIYLAFFWNDDLVGNASYTSHGSA